jgi:ribonucleoside-diphosphate reductase alpha subunit
MGRIRTLLLLLAATADARSLGPAGAGASAVTSSASDRADRLASSTSSSTTSTAAAAAAASALHVPRSPQPPNGEPQPTQQPTQRPTQMALQENIQARYQSLCSGLDPHISPAELALKVCSGLPSASVSPAQLSELMSETAAAQSSLHPDFARLAARVSVAHLHDTTEPGLLVTLQRMHDHKLAGGEAAPLVSAELVERAARMAPALEAALEHTRDYDYDYFGLRTLQRSYLHKGSDGRIIERPQHMLMRVALCVHGDDLPSVLQAYSLMTRGQYTHATPTLFNAGSPRQQLCSCFLLTAKEDSIPGIFETLSRCALISRDAGGIGVSVSQIRASQSYIRSSGGRSSGLVPMLRVFDATARYVDQGGGKRKGAFAIYLEPWHADVFAFLDLKKNHGKEEARARDLFYALWIPDLFMKRVEEGGDWSLFCPDEAPGLADCHSEAFERLYTQYESEGLARRTVPAQQLWFKILEAQMETGTPYMLFKDAANAKSNQQHLGTIRGSNLCTEIIEYTSPDEVAVCNLASIALPRFVRADRRGAPLGGDEASQPREAGEEGGGDVHAARAAGGGGGGVPPPSEEEGEPPLSEEAAFDFEELRRVTRFVAMSLDRVISVTHYPLPEAENSNTRHRPVGIGVQGLADVFAMLRLPFESAAAADLNAAIFETMYYGALEASCELAEALGPHPSYESSPASRGELQFDLWGVTPTPRWDWAGLKARIARHGLRNSLLMAPMPTASTAQILGNNECFEPVTSNLYARRTLAGEFFLLNPHLQKELQSLGLWSRETRDRIISAGGSVQGLPSLPDSLKAVYKTAWEIKQRTLIDLAADRGAFIDQSQSLNLFLKEPTFSQVSSMHFHAWRRGLKTGMYYLRTQPAAEAIQFTVQNSDGKPGRPAGSAEGGGASAEGGGAAGSAGSEGNDGAEDSAQREAAAARCALNSAPGECEMCSS